MNMGPWKYICIKKDLDNKDLHRENPVDTKCLERGSKNPNQESGKVDPHLIMALSPT